MAHAAPTGTVTLMFSDIEGSTRLLRRLGDAYAGLLSTHRELMREAFVGRGGFEVDTQGDAFFVTFGSAHDAVAAAAEIQRALFAHAWPEGHELRVRIGLHTGEPAFVDGHYVGLDVHHCARVMAAGHGGQVLVSESTRALLDDRVRLHDLGEHRLKDLAEPQRLYQLEIEGLPAEFPPLNTLENRPTNLPAPPTHVHRAGARAHGRRVAARARGPARRHAHRPGRRGQDAPGRPGGGRQLENFPNGVFFVSLSPVRDWELVVPTIARSLGLREYPGETMLETLAELPARQAAAARPRQPRAGARRRAARSPACWRAAPRLRVLATSRAPLHLSGEPTFAVPALAALRGRRALFVRASPSARVAPTSTSTPENAAAVAEICRRLDGLPLAIELRRRAHARSRPPRCSRGSTSACALLTGGAADLPSGSGRCARRSSGATTCWTGGRAGALRPARRFVGGCTLDAAEAVCGRRARSTCSTGSRRSSDKSLLRRRTGADGEPRFWMLETIREYAVEMLHASGEVDEARRCHAVWFAQEAERLDVESRTGDRSRCLARLDDDYANLNAAIDFARETRDGELMLRLVTALWGFWSTRGYVAEGRRALEDAFELADRRPARALLGLCTLRTLSGTSEGVLEDAREAMQASEELGDDFTLAQAWNLVGRIEGGIHGHMQQAEEAFENAVSYAERGDYAAEKAEAIGWLLLSAVFGPLPAADGIVRCEEYRRSAIRRPRRFRRGVASAARCSRRCRGEFDNARELLAEGTRALEELGLIVWAANTAQEAFVIESIAGTPESAIERLRHGYETLNRMGERGLLSTVAGFLAHALYACGDYVEAARVQQESEERPRRTTCSRRSSGEPRARRSSRSRETSTGPSRSRSRPPASARRPTS